MSFFVFLLVWMISEWGHFALSKLSQTNDQVPSSVVFNAIVMKIVFRDQLQHSNYRRVCECMCEWGFSQKFATRTLLVDIWLKFVWFFLSTGHTASDPAIFRPPALYFFSFSIFFQKFHFSFPRLISTKPSEFFPFLNKFCIQPKTEKIIRFFDREQQTNRRSTTFQFLSTGEWLLTSFWL